MLQILVDSDRLLNLDDILGFFFIVIGGPDIKESLALQFSISFIVLENLTPV